MKLSNSDKVDSVQSRQVGTLRAVPRKRALRNDARRLSISDAVGEVIDNAIDNFAKQKKLGFRSEKVTISITMKPEEILIEEDSGGVSPGDLLAFVQVGATGEDVGTPSIGVWGAGQKQAIAALGHDVTILTRHWNARQEYPLDETSSDQVMLRMDEAWWFSEENWDVPVFLPSMALSPGTTRYEVHALNRKIDDDVIRELKEEVSNIYGDLLTGANASILINDDEVEGNPHLSDSVLERLFAFPPGFEPSRQWFDLEWVELSRDRDELKEKLHRIRLELIVGITARQDKANAGVYMYGVPTAESGEALGPRFFAGPLQDERVGYSEGPRSILRKGDPTLGRLRMIAIFYGDSEEIPWGLPGSPVKKGYNVAAPVAEQVKRCIKEAAAPYARYASTAKEIDVVPFSEEWNQRSEDEAWKKNLFRRGANVKDIGDLDDPEIKKDIEEFVNRGEFVPSGFLEWDRAAEPETPPKPAPALVDEMAKRVTSDLRARNEGLKKKGEDEPIVALKDLATSLRDLYTERPKKEWESESVDEIKVDRTVSVSVRMPGVTLRRLREAAKTRNNSEALKAAVDFFIEAKQGGDPESEETKP